MSRSIPPKLMLLDEYAPSRERGKVDMSLGLGSKYVDEAHIADGKGLVYDSESDSLVYAASSSSPTAKWVDCVLDILPGSAAPVRSGTSPNISWAGTGTGVWRYLLGYAAMPAGTIITRWRVQGYANVVTGTRVKVALGKYREAAASLDETLIEEQTDSGIATGAIDWTFELGDPVTTSSDYLYLLRIGLYRGSGDSISICRVAIEIAAPYQG